MDRPEAAQAADSIVVVGVDGSMSSRAALRHALAEATQRAAILRVVSAYDPPELWALAYGSPARASTGADAVRAETQHLVDEALDPAGRQAGQRGRAAAPRIELLIRPGPVGPILVDTARDADLLVIGHRGRGHTTNPLGSAALYCVLNATCPVTVVRPTARTARNRTPITPAETGATTPR